MTGYATYAISGYYTYMHAFARTSSGGVTDLGSLPGMDSSIGNAINANGDVAGKAFLSDFGGTESVYGDPGVGDQAFLAVNGPGGYTMTDLAPPAGDNTSEAYGVNKYDMVVWRYGYLTASGDTSYECASLDHRRRSGPAGRTCDLNTLNTYFPGVIPSGWILTTQKASMTAGQIVGTATKGGTQYASS